MASVGIEEEFVSVEKMTGFRFPGTKGSKAIGSSLGNPLNTTEMDIASLSWKPNSVGFVMGMIRIREKAEENRFGVLRDHGKIHGTVLSWSSTKRTMGAWIWGKCWHKAKRK